MTHCHVRVLCQYKQPTFLKCSYLCTHHICVHFTCMCTLYLNMFLFHTLQPTLYYNILCVYFTCTLSDMQITLLLDVKSCMHSELIIHVESHSLGCPVLSLMWLSIVHTISQYSHKIITKQTSTCALSHDD